MQIEPHILNIKQQLETLTQDAESSEALMEITQLLTHLQQFDRPEVAHSRRRSDSSQLPKNLTELGDRCIQQLESVALSVKAEDPDKSREIECLSFPLALWVTQHGGELKTLTPIVNAIAYDSNQSHKTEALERLYHMVNHVLEGICPHSLQSAYSENQKAWRVLLLNHGIIATRTHNATLIESAYQNLVEKIPEDAPQFFEQGMAQMVKINYPDHVKSIVQKYYTQWHQAKILH